PRGGVVVEDLAFVAFLDQGTPIDSSSDFFLGQAVVDQFYLCEFQTESVGGYLGLEFRSNGEIHYGWAEVDVYARFDSTTGTMHADLVGYAYETIPNQSIKAGQTTGP